MDGKLKWTVANAPKSGGASHETMGVAPPPHKELHQRTEQRTVNVAYEFFYVVGTAGSHHHLCEIPGGVNTDSTLHGMLHVQLTCIACNTCAGVSVSIFGHVTDI